MRLLILGGTTEARELANVLAGDRRFQAQISLAGRTTSPAVQPLPTRVGGFGGSAGLADYLRAGAVDALIDATHPFAARITANAVAAATQTGARLLVVLRPPWRAVAGDRWTQVATVADAVAALGPQPRRVLLTVGQQDLTPFAHVPLHRYVLRSVDPPPPGSLPRDADIIVARGPFAEADERRLLLERRIDVIVTKNSGGTATAAKLAAARALALPVVMVARPPPPPVATVATVGEVLAWLEAVHAALRGV